MKILGIVALSALSFSVFACSADSADSSDTSEGAATASETTVCEGADTKVAILKDGLVTLTKAGSLYAVGSAKASALTLSADKKTAKYKSAKLTCAGASGADASAWAVAGALAKYEGDIDGLASQVTDEMSGDGSGSRKAKAPNPYLVFAIETSKRGSLDLGTKADKSTGSLPGTDNDSNTLDDDDNTYGGLSAAYDLGGGEDFGEWFQGASDGISISGSIAKALGSAHAGFVGHQKCKALNGLVASKDASAVELTVGSLTFLVPNDFSK